MVDAPDILVEEFSKAAEARGDNPDAALERLMLEYIRQDSTITELFASRGEPVTSLPDYDPDDDRPLGYAAADSLPSYAETPAIDPDDVVDEELPQYRDAKRQLILGVLKYWRNREDGEIVRQQDGVVRRDEVMAAAKAVVGDFGKEDDYKREEYVEQVIDELLVRNPGDERMAFLSPLDAVEYLESLEPPNHKAESDVYHLSRHLVERYEDVIDRDTVNAVRRRFSFNPLD